MRELLFKHLTALGSRKKDILLKDVFEKDGVVAKTERRCFYFIKEIKKMDGEEGVQQWLNSQRAAVQENSRHFHILKEHNEGHGEDKLVCKIAGTFYAIAGSTIYTIAFLHSFKVMVTRASLT